MTLMFQKKGLYCHIYNKTDSEFSKNEKPIRHKWVKSMYELSTESDSESAYSDSSPPKKKSKPQAQNQKKLLKYQWINLYRF